MKNTKKYLTATIVLLSLLAVLLFVLSRPKKHTARLNVPLAHDTGACYPDISRIVVLRVTGRGLVTLGPDKVTDGQLAGRLRTIFGVRAERVLYIFPENDAPFPRVAQIVDLVQHLQSERTQTHGVPRELQAQPENMNIGEAQLHMEEYPNKSGR